MSNNSTPINSHQPALETLISVSRLDEIPQKHQSTPPPSNQNQQSTENKNK